MPSLTFGWCLSVCSWTPLRTVIVTSNKPFGR